MPSFDVVSEVDGHQLTNAVDQSNRVVDTRFDFKGIEARFERDDYVVNLTAEAEFQLQQMVDMLRATLIKCSIDPECMEVGDVSLSGKLSKQSVQIKQGLDQPMTKKIVKMVKEMKLKVQAQVQGEQVRVTGKKRDELQQVMAMLREADIGLPLQFDNFRD
ncbi:MAG: YajQ family cyclic di-GMP-binding protein [Pseudomonadales bacterium]